MHPEDRPKLKKLITRLLNNNESFNVDHRIVLPDGSVQFLHSIARLEFDLENKPVRLFGVSQDITERKKTEEDLKIKEKAIATSINGIGIVNQDGKLFYVNESLVKMWGYDSADEILDRQLPDFWKGNGVYDTLETLQSKGWAFGVDIGRKKDGTTFPVQFSASAIKDDAGKPLFMFGSFIDISEKEKAEEELRRIQVELAHMDRIATIGAMTGAIAHEINQPLAAILNNAQAALRYLNNDNLEIDEVREALKDIVLDNKRASEIIRRIRGFVKKKPQSHAPFELNALIKESVRLIQNESVIFNVSISTALDSQLPVLYGDNIQIQQVVLNLLLNAMDAVKDQPKDQRQIKLTSKGLPSTGVQLTIADSGPGIEPAEIETIFDPLFSTKSQGLGLGLTICRTIVDSFGGKLWAENRPEGGAAFYLQLPQRIEGTQ